MKTHMKPTTFGTHLTAGLLASAALVGCSDENAAPQPIPRRLSRS